MAAKEKRPRFSRRIRRPAGRSALARGAGKPARVSPGQRRERHLLVRRPQHREQPAHVRAVRRRGSSADGRANRPPHRTRRQRRGQRRARVLPLGA